MTTVASEIFAACARFIFGTSLTPLYVRMVLLVAGALQSAEGKNSPTPRGSQLIISYPSPTTCWSSAPLSPTKDIPEPPGPPGLAVDECC